MNKFLTNTDETGRFIVYSKRTGKTYAVEPIWSKTPNWGSVDPATGDFRTKKGFKKYTGAVSEKESLITEENGFINVQTLDKGVSPIAAIEQLDRKYPDKEDRH